LTRARLSDLRRRCQAHPAPKRMREVNGLDPVLNCMTKLICAPHTRSPSQNATEEGSERLSGTGGVDRDACGAEEEPQLVRPVAANAPRRESAASRVGDIQQERIDLAARELSDVGDRLQAAANALRESI
jgi:hypothetical protein